MRNTSLAIGLLLMLFGCLPQTKTIPVSITSQIQHDVQSIMQAEVSCQDGKPVSSKIISFKLEGDNIPLDDTNKVANTVQEAICSGDILATSDSMNITSRIVYLEPQKDPWDIVFNAAQFTVEKLNIAKSSNSVDDWASAVLALETVITGFADVSSDHPKYNEAQEQLKSYEQSLALARKNTIKTKLIEERNNTSTNPITKTVAAFSQDLGLLMAMEVQCPAKLSRGIGVYVNSKWQLYPPHEITQWESSIVATEFCNGNTSFVSNGTQVELKEVLRSELK